MACGCAAMPLRAGPGRTGGGGGIKMVETVQRKRIEILTDTPLVPRVVAITDARNLPSIRLLERVGMRRVEDALLFAVQR